jgi:hypothetical protein
MSSAVLAYHWRKRAVTQKQRSSRVRVFRRVPDIGHIRHSQQRKDAMWRARIRRPLILDDRTFPCDVIRREHSPPLARLPVVCGAE